MSSLPLSCIPCESKCKRIVLTILNGSDVCPKCGHKLRITKAGGLGLNYMPFVIFMVTYAVYSLLPQMKQIPSRYQN